MASEHITTTFTSQSQNILHTLDNKDNGQQSTRTTTSQPQQTHNDRALKDILLICLQVSYQPLRRPHCLPRSVHRL